MSLAINELSLIMCAQQARPVPPRGWRIGIQVDELNICLCLAPGMRAENAIDNNSNDRAQALVAVVVVAATASELDREALLI